MSQHEFSGNLDDISQLPEQAVTQLPEPCGRKVTAKLDSAISELIATALQPHSEHLASIREDCATLRAEVKDLCDAMQSLSNVDAMHSDLLDRYRALSDQFHEREVLRPVLLSLIGIVDRCQEQEEILCKAIDRQSPTADGFIQKALTYAKACQSGSRVDAQSSLADFGVQAFQHPNATFNPECQSSRDPVPTTNQDLVGRIAARLRPGYRREAKIVRPEIVRVYVEAISDIQKETLQ